MVPDPSPWVNTALRCAFMALTEDKDRAEPITRLLGKRVAEQRKSIGMNQTQLGTRMAELGLGWTRYTVVKLENNKRESISLQDWLALAQVLRVPPIWLLVDPRGGESIPVAEGVEVDPWTFLMWMTGHQVIGEPTGTNWANKEDVGLLLEVERLWKELAWLNTNLHRLRTTKLDERHREALGKMVREGLGDVRDCLGHIADAGAVVPAVPAEVVKSAAELGIDLPGQEG